MSLAFTSGTTPFVFVSILKPDGSTLLATFISGLFGAFLDTITLPATGTYTIRLDPYATNTGSVTLQLYDIVDVTGTVTIGGPAVPVTVTMPGQNASLTFAGTAAQPVTVRVTNNTMLLTVKLLAPDGTTLTSVFTSAGSFDLAPQTLSTTGTYTIAIDPWDARTGSLDVAVTSP